MFCFFCGILTAFSQLLYLGWTVVDFLFDFAAGLIPDDRIIPLLSAKISAVAVNSIFFSGQQLRYHCDIMCIGTDHLKTVNQVAILICTDMSLISEMPRIALLYLMRIRIPFPFLLLICKQFLLNAVLLKNMPKPSQCISIRHLVAGFDAAEL